MASSYPALDLRFAQVTDPSLDELLYAALDEFQPLAIQEHDAGDGWLVFFRLPSQRAAAIDALGPFVTDARLTITSLDVPDEDWARRSQASLTAIRVGRITVAPPWDVPAAPESIVLVIEPSMGFGTGHHQTTRLCLELLQGIDLAGRAVVDVGTGSGVLALAAHALGASPVVAMDNDPDALQNARDNLERNAAAHAVSLACSELSAFTAPPADIVTANLTAAVLIAHAGSLRRLVGPGGSIIVSGFSPIELPEVTEALEGAVVQEAQEGEWCAARLTLDCRGGGGHGEGHTRKHGDS